MNTVFPIVMQVVANRRVLRRLIKGKFTFACLYRNVMFATCSIIVFPASCWVTCKQFWPAFLVISHSTGVFFLFLCNLYLRSGSVNIRRRPLSSPSIPRWREECNRLTHLGRLTLIVCLKLDIWPARVAWRTVYVILNLFARSRMQFV